VKKFLPTAIVLGLLAALLSYVLLFESKPVDPAESAERLYRVKPADIAKITLESPESGTSVVLEKQADGLWWITSPGRYEADTGMVEEVLSRISAPAMERRIGPNEGAQYGLDAPTFRATAETRKGKKHSFSAGRKNPTETAYFALAGGANEVCMVPASVVDGMRKSVRDLRSRQLAPIIPASVTRLVIRRSATDTMEFNRTAPDAWMMTKPGQGNADRYTIEGYLEGIKNLRGTDILDEPGAPGRYRLDIPAIKVEVYSSGGKEAEKPFTLSLSKPYSTRNDAYGMSSRLPFVMRLPDISAITESSRPADDYRERVLLAANKDELSSAVIRVQGREFTCRRGLTGKWSVTRPSGVKTGPELDDMLFELIYVRAEKFLGDGVRDFSRFGLSKPAAEVEVTGKKDGKYFHHRYTLGKSEGGFTCMRWNGGTSVYGIRGDIIMKLSMFAESSVNTAVKPPLAATPPRPAPKKKK